MGGIQKDIPNYFENWRKIRSDLVFQPPSKMELFSAILGNGYQLILTLFIVLLLGFVGLKYYSKYIFNNFAQVNFYDIDRILGKAQF